MKLFEEFREYETMWDLVEAENSDQVAIENFFAQITKTPLDALQFIKEYLKVAIDKIGSDATSYDIGREFAKILLDKTDAQQEDVTLGNKYGYRAFLSKLADLDLTKYKVEQAILGDDAVINKMIARAGTRVSTAAKPVLTQYFNKITSSKDAAISFITLMSKYISDSNRNFNLAYNRAIVEETTDTKAYKIKTDPEHNYDAFLQAISVYGLNTKDVRTICNKGQARMNALEIFVEITDSVEAVKEFMRNLRQQYAELSDGSNTRMVYRLAYNKWFLANTNATVAGPNKIKPEEVNWNNFTETCWKKFGIAARDLTAFYRNELDAVPEVQSQDRHWTTASKAAKPTLEDYFSSITNDYDSAVFFIKEVLAPYANRRAKPDLASSYYSAMTNKTVATEPEIRKNPQCNYRAFKFAISKLGIYTKELEALIAT
jgi:predicted hydrocarbon binding protein